MSKTYKIAGYTVNSKGLRKFRVGQDVSRSELLTKQGHTDIVWHDLPTPMTKPQARAFMEAGAVAQVTQSLTLTMEQALSKVPSRNDRGHFIKREVREQMARELMAA